MVKKFPDPDKVVKKAEPKAAEKRAVKMDKGSPKAKRTAARLSAVQVLYQMGLNNQDAKSAVREFVDHRAGFKIDGDVLVPPDTDLLEEIVLGIESRWDDVNALVSGALSAGKKESVEALLEAILRAGAFELMKDSKTDAGIIINDYMNVTTAFYDGTEPKLINAVLDRIAKTVRN